MSGPHTYVRSTYIIFLDNSSSDGDACSDVDEEFSVVEDSLLCDSVTFANGTTSTPQAKRQRTSGVHFQEPQSTRVAKPVAPPVTTVSPPARRSAPVEHQPPINTPMTLSVTNSGQNTMVLTSSDGNSINMWDVMNDIMMQITSINKMVSKQEESETSRK